MGGRGEWGGSPGIAADRVIRRDRRNLAGAGARSLETPWGQAGPSWRHHVSLLLVTEMHSPTAHVALYTSNGRAASTGAGRTDRLTEGALSTVKHRNASLPHRSEPPRTRVVVGTPAVGIRAASAIPFFRPSVAVGADRPAAMDGPNGPVLQEPVPEPCYCCSGRSPSRPRCGVRAHWRCMAVFASKAAGLPGRVTGYAGDGPGSAAPPVGIPGQPLVTPRDE